MSSREDARGGDRGGEEPGGESSGGFRVIDRRRFAPDGSERDGSEAAPAASQPKPAPTPPSSARAPVRESPPAAASESEHLGQPVGDAYDPAEGQPLEATFTTLVMSLSTQALLLLGEIQAPGEESPVDLAGARHLIDLLGVLQAKTAGNLDAAEGQILERILYDLRMRFVEISRSAGR